MPRTILMLLIGIITFISLSAEDSDVKIKKIDISSIHEGERPPPKISTIKTMVVDGIISLYTDKIKLEIISFKSQFFLYAESEKIEPTIVPSQPPPAQVYAAQKSGFYWDNDPSCISREDRYNWQSYALEAGFPLEVVNSQEMIKLIEQESGGDLCAVNNSSGATCWIQQYPGGPDFLDPRKCMAQGYNKWLDGGQSFQKHWYNFWR